MTKTVRLQKSKQLTMQGGDKMKKVKESNAAIKIILLTIFVILFIAVYFIDSVFLAGDAISYGKFSFIGKLIPSVMLAAAFAALCFAMFNKKKRKLCVIISAALVVFIVPILFLANTIVVNIEYKTFDSAKWKNYSNHVQGRQYMIDDLEEKHKIVGMKTYEVKDLLGKGTDETSADGSNKITYDVGVSGLWHKTYILEYDENGIITKTYTSVD